MPDSVRTVLITGATSGIGRAAAVRFASGGWNVVGLTRLLLPTLIRRRGAIINVSSTAANYPHASSVVYGGSKAFVSHFSMALRSDLHGTGVRVTVVEPGRTTTEIVAETDCLQLTAADVAAAIFAIAELPAHVNVNKLELMPVSQSLAGYQIDRTLSSLPTRD